MVKDLQLDIEGLGELEGLRGCDLGQCFVDITKRDIEENKYNIDITVYVKPGVPEDHVMHALQKACVDIWGSKPAEHLELFYLPPSLELIAGDQSGAFASYGVTIKHPDSLYYNIDRLEHTILGRIKSHLEKQ